MWLLRNHEKGLLYRVTPGRQHVITRKEGDLVLLGDKSISRMHAQVQVVEENEEGGIILKDLGSKYGTFTIFGGGELVQLSPNHQVTLRQGDSVRFGVQWNIWRVEHIQLLVATSTLTQEEKSGVNQLISSLGGTVVSDWQAECSHLTMNKLTVTVKVVCALASGQPIVTPSFWTRFSQSVSTMQAKLPDCKDYLPPLAEAMLNPSEVSFAPNPARSKLFQGYTFVAASAKQVKRITPMITAAGGKVVEFSSKIWTEDRFSDDKTILMLSSPSEKQGSQQSQTFDGYIPMARNLKSKGIRCIPESEIGLSVLHCSLSKFCNPHFHNQSLIGSTNSTHATQHVTVICPNTEESMTTDQENINPIPGPSGQSTRKKRELEDSNRSQEPSPKRPDLRENSEDFFGTQDLNNSVKCNGDQLSLKKNLCLLDKPSPKEAVKVNHFPSLDMFASSGEKSCTSNVHNQSAVPPSCEDMFASSGSRQHLKRKQDVASDEFSFPQRNVNKNKNEEEDEFSFESIKNCKKSKTQTDNASDRISLNRIIETEKNEEDLFSFASAKRPNKRNRQSNPDMFASSAEISMDDSIAGPSKNKISFKSQKQNHNEDDLFVFPDDHNTKRRRINDQVLDFDRIGSEVKIALLSNGHEPEQDCSHLEEQKHYEDPPESKNLITYSKLKPMSKVKKETVDDEIDELANELRDATVIVVKSLVVVRDNPQHPNEVQTGKNFKKFRKVWGANRSVVPHIIGHSDMVSHFNVGQDTIDKNLSPEQNIPYDSDDEWTFNKGKNKKKNKLTI